MRQMPQVAVPFRKSKNTSAADHSLILLALLGFIVLALVISQPEFQQPGALNAVVPLAVVVAVFGLALTLSPSVKRTPLALWLMGLLLVRLGIAAFYHEWYWTKYYVQFLSGLTQYDAFRYDASALQVVLYGWQNARLSMPQFGPIAFYALIYGIFGYNPLFAVLFNTLLGGLTSLVIFNLALPVTSLRVARWSALMTMILPISVVYGALLMKETLVTFLFCWGLVQFSRVKSYGKWFDLLILVGIFYGLMETRAAYALILVGGAVVTLFMERRLASRRLPVFLFGGLVFVLLAGAGVSSATHGANILTPGYWLERFTNLQYSTSLLLSTWPTDPTLSLGLRTAVDLASPATYVFIPFRFATLYLVPLFWQWGMSPDFTPFEEISSFLSWASVPAVVWGVRRLMRQPGRKDLWVMFLLGTLVISIGAPFVEPRYKLALQPLYFLIAMIGFEEFRKWRKYYVPYAYVVVASIGGYYIVKALLGG
jgi:hypothetical protein